MKNFSSSRLFAVALITIAAHGSTMSAYADDEDVRALKEKIEVQEQVILTLRKQVSELRVKLGEAQKEKAQLTENKPEKAQAEEAKKSPSISGLDEALAEATKNYAKEYEGRKKAMSSALLGNIRGTVVFGAAKGNFRTANNDLISEISRDRFYVGRSAGAPKAWLDSMPNIVAGNGGVEHPGPFDVGFHGMRCEQVIDGHTVLASRWAIANGAVTNIDDREIVAICGLETTQNLVDKAPWTSPYIALFESGTYSYMATNGAKRTVKRVWAFQPEKVHQAGMELLHPELKKAREAKEKKAPQASADSGNVLIKNDIEKKLTGTKWNWWEDQTVVFLSDGRVVFPQHKKTGTWKVVDVKNRIINGTMPWNSKVFIYKFNADFTEAQRAEGKDGTDFKAAVKLIAPPVKADESSGVGK